MDEMDGKDVTTINQLECNVCGENVYEMREGYYHCVECGTVAQNVKLIEVEDMDDFENRRFARTKKIRLPKQVGLEPTSWECYNYILRGLVHDLINLGAKDELQLITLQLWAAYLRRIEVAFFNKKNADLPHLGVRYSDKDAELIYNHKKQNKKKRMRRKTIESATSFDSTGRDYRRSVRQLDESMYSINSQSETETEYTVSSGNSSSTGRTSRAIRISFSNSAKKIYKKKMSKAHLKIHANNADGSLKCHNTKIKATDLKLSIVHTHTLNIKQLYGILCIALNLIEDDIQLCDFVRYVADDLITTSNIVNYFPENLQSSMDKILQAIHFNNSPTKFTYQFLRDHINELAKFINIREFKMPNIKSLVDRYVTELHLPKYLSVIIHRLINVLPPSQCTRIKTMYGAFEARAMAYIIFVLKLLFGLDGEKEQFISKSAQTINERLTSLPSQQSIHSQLFVWDDWVQYIEMRKILLSRYNNQFAIHFKQSQNTVDFIKEMQSKHEVDEDLEFIPRCTNMKYSNYRSIADFLSQSFPESTKIPCTLKQMPSLTPAHDLFNEILKNANDDVPKYMHKDHTQTAIEPYLCHKALDNCLSKHNVRLCVKELDCNKKREFIGIFQMPGKYLGIKSKTLKVYKADFSINERDWKEQIVKNSDMDDGIEYKTEFSTYHRVYYNKLKRQYRKLNYDDNRGNGTIKTGGDCTLETTASMQFDEDDMTPLPNAELRKPRTNLESFNIFDTDETVDNASNVIDNTDIESDENSGPAQLNVQDDCVSLTLHRSSMDYWQLLGHTTAMKEIQKKDLATKFPRSFFWLLETCAQIIGVDWLVVYEQLLVLEVMFGHGLANLADFTDCLHYNHYLKTKEINSLVIQNRKMW